MRYGICTDIRKVREVQEAGYDYIEGKLNQFALWSEDDFNAVLAEFAQCSVKMERCCLLFPKTMAVIGPDYDEKAMLSYLQVAFSRMQALGCNLVVFGSGKSRFVPEGMKWRDAYRQLVAVTRLVGKTAEPYGINIAIEPLNRGETNLINSLAEGSALVCDVDLPNVGLLADAYHIRMEDEDIQRVVLCSPLMHTHVALKEGRAYPTVDCEEVRTFLEKLKAAGYDGTMSIEGNSSDWKADSAVALKVLRSLA